MEISDYIKERGLPIKLVAQSMGVSRQALCHYGKQYEPTLKTLSKIATAMTELGAPTNVADLVHVIYDK